jgi:hypothetical protein
LPAKGLQDPTTSIVLPIVLQGGGNVPSGTGAAPVHDDLVQRAATGNQMPDDLRRLAELWGHVPAAVRQGWVATAEALAGQAVPESAAGHGRSSGAEGARGEA